MLTQDIITQLRAPFAAAQIKWKIQQNPAKFEGKEPDEGWALAVCYIDARDVAERLDAATNGDWWDTYGLPLLTAGDQISLECQLTVCGVTRRDVGTVASPRDGDDATKDLYSDAFKRAAVKFGIGTHLYRFPNVRARATKVGRSWYLTGAAEQELAELTHCLLANDASRALPRFEHLNVFGTADGAGGTLLFGAEPEPVPERSQAHVSQSTTTGQRGAQSAQTRGSRPVGTADPQRLATGRAALAAAEAAASRNTTRTALPSHQEPLASDGQLGLIASLLIDLDALDAQEEIDQIGQTVGVTALSRLRSRARLAEVALSKQTASTIITELKALVGP